MLKYRLMGGLGDCLIAAASLQALNKPVLYQTNPLLKRFFEHHPTVKFAEDDGKCDYEFKWVSQIKDKDLYGLHTMQRFSAQLGFYIDPTDVFNIYAPIGQLVNVPFEKTVCINQFSAEKNRRLIPDEYLNTILETIPEEYKIVWIGGNKGFPIKDIDQITEKLLNCSLFIGPVSFCYHLAACLRVPSLLFTSYMPSWKFSHQFDTVSIESKQECTFMCEKNNIQCRPNCLALNYDKEEIIFNLRKML